MPSVQVSGTTSPGKRSGALYSPQDLATHWAVWLVFKAGQMSKGTAVVVWPDRDDENDDFQYESRLPAP